MIKDSLIMNLKRLNFTQFLFHADRSARLWDVETGQCLLKYLGHNGSGILSYLVGKLSGKPM